ncbi:MAG: DUF4469 domain-containing protein [Dysgonamonadaceae bacterium]|jgi:hypothetical protein|nr:DUF4469 domain-containing protein [Dysgonamonadaceae bacterium]
MDYVMGDNPLTPQESNDRYARVVNGHSYTSKDLAEAIAKGNIGISKAEALAVLEAEADIQLRWLAEGFSINTRLAHFHPSIPGKFLEGEFPHEAVIRITPSKEVVKLAKKIPLRHVEPARPIRIETVYDVKSDTVNSMITGGGTVKIKGHNLKVMGTDPTVGVEFVNADNPTAVHPVAVKDIIVNNPSKLIVIAPAMSSGEEVYLKVTTQYSKSVKGLKTPRSITFEKKLTVV